jgi:hypothetical protein
MTYNTSPLNKTIVDVVRDDYRAEITELDGKFRLYWTDYIEDWDETFSTLCVALLRLAVLDTLTKERPAFTYDDACFTLLAEEWLEEQYS